MLAYSECGHGDPVLFIHGISSDRSRWEIFTEQLADDFRCIAIDLPGHGRSPSEGCDALSAASAVHDLVEHLDLDSPIVVGHSLGGTVGLLYGVLFQPRSIIGIDPIHLHLPYLSSSLAPHRARFESDEFETAFLEWEMQLGIHVVPEPQRSILIQGMHPRRDVVLAYWETVLDPSTAAGIQHQITDGLVSITAPTLLLFAEPPRPEDAAILERMTSTTVEVWDGLGHFLHFVDPQRFIDRVRTWIAHLH